MNIKDFYAGRAFDAHHYLGCHIQGDTATFRVYAPRAAGVTVIGDFNGWENTELHRIGDGKIWECTIHRVYPGQLYKYRIYTGWDVMTERCDPYGYGMELRPKFASVVRNLRDYIFHDQEWLNGRSDCKDRPLNIYELHAGSWRRNPESETGWYTYSELARILIPYLKEQGYNYVELMPLAEHPSDESWGYQSTGFFAPTSRYGTADQLKEMVDLLHQAEIGVILDFVPVHFAVDGYALADFDGEPLYEYPHADVGRSEWGSCNFNHSKGEVRSFLQSCANYWMEEYHVDGLRMDAISNMIYWQGNKDRGVNENAVKFLKNLNQGLKERHPGILLAAEDSTSFGRVTKATWDGGLGFDYKWDMGWMNDTLNYFRSDPFFRCGGYHKLTFSMMYYPEEHYLLPLSHDEVVHGKATIVQRMNGQYEDKFPQAKALYMYMYAHPGKKLNFMGTEIGSLREWDEKRELDWDILRFPIHDAFRHFVRDLNHLYLDSPELWKWDYKPEGFRWIDCHQEERCIYAMERCFENEKLIAIFNFSGVEQKDYTFGIANGTYETVLSSETDIYGGTETEKKVYKTRNGSLSITLPRFSAIYLKKKEKSKK